ncbi:MAG TPA: hypothetical protein P5084_07350 [Paludibacter sp.]|nr:hypothetical protein [Paludibacter sp.]
MINNKTEFKIYRIAVIICFSIIIGYIGLIAAKLIGIDIINISNNGYFALISLVLLFLLISEKIKPALIEFTPNDNEITIRAYTPITNSWKSLFNFLGNNFAYKEYKVSSDDFNSYILSNGFFGLRKELKLQKTKADGIYQSANINISLLSKEKQTNLIIAIERLSIKLF